MMDDNKIREILKQKNLKVVDRFREVRDMVYTDGTIRGTYVEEYYTVIWLDRDKTKYGHLDADFRHRYGIRVLATYDTDSNRFWFMSNDVANSIPDEHLQHMRDIDAGKFTKLKDLDTRSIKISW